MTVEQYIAAMAERGINREGLEHIKPFNSSNVSSLHQSAYLPGGEEKSKVPIKPPSLSEDLSALNPANVKRARKGKAA